MSIALYWDLQNQKLVESTNSTAKVERMEFVLRDTLPVTLRVLNEQANITVPYVVTAIDAGSSIIFGAKALATYATDANFLFNQAVWTAAGSGTTTTYSADIPLNTAALIDAMGTASYLDCKAEFTIVNSSNEHELSTQLTWRILKDVIVGSEGVPASEYTVISQYTDDNNVAAVRIVNGNGVCMALFKNGCLYSFCRDDGLWYPDVVRIIDGVAVKTLGAGEAI